MRTARNVALILAAAAALWLVVASADDSDERLGAAVLVIVVGAIAAWAIRRGPIQPQDTEEPRYSIHLMHICPRCGHRMRLRRGGRRLLWFACPNCALGTEVSGPGGPQAR